MLKMFFSFFKTIVIKVMNPSAINSNQYIGSFFPPNNFKENFSYPGNKIQLKWQIKNDS